MSSHPKPLKVALAGAGAFGIKHLDGIRNIDGIEVISLVGRELDKTREVAAKYGIPHATTELADTLKLAELDAVILATPTQMHASQTNLERSTEPGLAESISDIPSAPSSDADHAAATLESSTGN